MTAEQLLKQTDKQNKKINLGVFICTDILQPPRYINIRLKKKKATHGTRCTAINQLCKQQTGHKHMLKHV